jgi:prepilin-type N-terminal cleavage/methylation domain-containing protein
MTTDTNVEPVVEQVQIQEKKKRGFTLTEIAIVLGIIGLILGAIWVAAAAVYNNLRVSKATTELLSVTQAMRSLYATQTTVAANGTPITLDLIRANVFPTDALDTGAPSNAANVNAPWSNSHILVYATQDPNAGSAAGDSFQVVFSNIPQSGCISLATNSTGAGRDAALVSVSFAGGVNAAVMPVAATAFPINVVTATAGCAAAADSVGFTFKLKG